MWGGGGGGGASRGGGVNIDNVRGRPRIMTDMQSDQLGLYMMWPGVELSHFSVVLMGAVPGAHVTVTP